MADKKISALPAVTMPLAETEVLPIVQSATTKKVTVAELTTLIKHTMTMDNTNPLEFGVAGFTASINYNADGSLRIKPRAGYPLQVDQANIKFSDAGYGIDFSANTGAPGMTSELLDWYEEGTWVPSVGGDATYTIQEGYYVRVGDLVYVQCQLLLNVLGTGSTTTISGLPFTAFAPSSSSRGTGSVWYCGNLATNVTSITPGVTPNSQQVTFGGFTAVGVAAATMTVPLTVFGNGTRVDFSLVYRAN